MSAPLQVYADRPAIINHAGGRIFLAIHDAAYLREARQWKRKLAAAHPDGGGNAIAFRKAKTAEERWRQREAAWYASVGHLPPAFGAKAVEPAAGRANDCTPERLLDLLRQRPQQTQAELAEGLGLEGPCVRDRIRMGIRMLRRRGAVIALVSFRYKEPSFYLLVSDRDCRAPFARVQE